MSWKIYQDWDNFTDNAVEYFQTFKRSAAKCWHPWREISAPRKSSTTTSPGSPQPSRTASSPSWSKAAPPSPKPRGPCSTKPCGADVPTLSWNALAQTSQAAPSRRSAGWYRPQLTPNTPGASTPVGSANFVYRLLDAVASNPDTWDSTAIFLNFDENDGYFDHVPPPVQPRPASGESTEWTTARPIGLGPRVPMTVVSPWTVGGYVSSEVFDHTSVLRFLERWTGVEEPNISPWRREVCGDLTGVFNFASPRHTANS